MLVLWKNYKFNWAKTLFETGNLACSLFLREITAICILCLFQSSTKIISFDADFQLVRKFSGGHAWTQPRHVDSFFLDQSSVDRFMSCYSGDVKEAGQVFTIKLHLLTSVCIPVGDYFVSFYK